MSLTNSCEGNVGEMNAPQIYDAFFDPSKRRLIKVTPEGIERALDLARSLDERRQLLTDHGILTNPYNLK